MTEEAKLIQFCMDRRVSLLLIVNFVYAFQ